VPQHAALLGSADFGEFQKAEEEGSMGCCSGATVAPVAPYAENSEQLEAEPIIPSQAWNNLGRRPSVGSISVYSGEGEEICRVDPSGADLADPEHFVEVLVGCMPHLKLYEKELIRALIALRDQPPPTEVQVIDAVKAGGKVTTVPTPKDTLVEAAQDSRSVSGSERSSAASVSRGSQSPSCPSSPGGAPARDAEPAGSKKRKRRGEEEAQQMETEIGACIIHPSALERFRDDPEDLLTTMMQNCPELQECQEDLRSGLHQAFLGQGLAPVHPEKTVVGSLKERFSQEVL